MARRSNRVCVPFQPILEKVVSWLQFPSPVYGFIDAAKNNVFVRVNTPNSRTKFIFYGGDATTVEESCDRAAHKAVKRLVCRFSVRVSDFTYERMKMYHLCVKLYKNLCAELVQDREDLSRIRAECITREDVPFHEIHVGFDFVQFLGVLVRKTGVTVTGIETTQLEGHGYMSWLMVTCPHNSIGMECIFSDPCAEKDIAQQRVAKKACFFISSVLHLEIVDVNYGSVAKLSADCSLIRERYLVLKGHVQCLGGNSRQPEAASCLVSDECVTPTDEANQIPVLALPPTVPAKRPMDRKDLPTSGVGVHVSDQLVTGLSELANVYKCARVE
ncbi:uncharacterized protein LOC110690190 [Chenopodium quinoa]|uniref:uncharacterized protein LOC110690190 n=1 Tax=Chenopodium quinoa TaxID=63459 RepID=UPI000B76EE71|nr:uncharacterized protein LOC110690190 [Chenopodium quinoa]XP_021722716.1 uncharacterized protein LOC110690190 [Chenopodium quinoa]